MKFHGDARLVANEADGYLSLNTSWSGAGLVIVSTAAYAPARGAVGWRSAKVVSRWPSYDGGSALTMKVSVPPGLGCSPAGAGVCEPPPVAFGEHAASASAKVSESAATRRYVTTRTTPSARTL